jgi:Ca2+-binding EF-hand superfamily protein
MNPITYGTLLCACVLTLGFVPQQRGAQRGTPRAKPTRSKAAEADELARTYFATADYDKNGWISFAEAEKSMGLDRNNFAVYDVDVDGRITSQEYVTHYRAMIARGGAVTPPIAKLDDRRVPRRTPVELIEAFDENEDAVLDESEIDTALEEYGVQDVEAKYLLEKLDLNHSLLLDGDELEDLADALAPGPLSAKRRVGSIQELFGQVEPRERRAGSTLQPARIAGPVSTFRRLDYDDSGKISLQDLTELQRPIQSTVRIHAVLATLDLDGDGELSAEEFRASVASPAERR